MTSKGSEDIAVRALRSGAASYVPKRNLAQDLLETVKRVLAVAGEQRSLERIRSCLKESRYSFSLDNDQSLIVPLVTFLQKQVGRVVQLDEAELLQMGVALEEALINALHHGNLELRSELREDDHRAYFALLEERAARPPYRDRCIHVDASISSRAVKFTVRDEGPGFDPTSVADPTDPANIERGHGRGLLLMQTFMNEVTHNERGNEVTLIKHPQPEPGATPATDA
jgi:anti-sigma regulatory factor (Ser/Thr protein kinase)